MTIAPRTKCDICCKEMPRAQRVLDGKAFCQTCAKRELVKLTCPGCGKSVTVKPGSEATLCRSCVAKDRVCTGCAKPLAKASIVKDGKAYCFNCSLKLREPRPCAWCGKITVYLTTSVPRGITEKVCYSCLSEHQKATCPHCRKYRFLVGVDEKGRNICRLCDERQKSGIPYVCPQCNKPGKRHSAAKCSNCYRIDFFTNLITEWSTGLRNVWVKNLALAWMEDYLAIHRKYFKFLNKKRLQNTTSFFNELDASCPSQEHLNLNYLFETFGTAWTNTYQQAFEFLVRSGRIPQRDHQAYTDINKYLVQLRYIEKASGTWFQPLLKEFHVFMQKIRERFQQHGWGSDERFRQGSIRAFMSAAFHFLECTGDTVQRASDLTSDHFFRFLISLPGYRCSLGQFVYFLNHERKVFQPVSLDHVPSGKSSGEVSRRKKSSRKIKSEARAKTPLVLSADSYHNLLGKLYTSPPSKARNSLICLFAVLYAQRPQKICNMRLDALTQDKDGTFRIKFASVPIPLDEHTAKILGMYLSQRLVMDKAHPSGNPYLFPGKSYGSYLSISTIENCFEVHGVKSNILYSTALKRFYQGGIAQPKVLMDALGITAITAMKYYEVANVRVVDELLYERGKSQNV